MTESQSEFIEDMRRIRRLSRQDVDKALELLRKTKGDIEDAEGLVDDNDKGLDRAVVFLGSIIDNFGGVEGLPTDYDDLGSILQEAEDERDLPRRLRGSEYWEE